MLICVLDIFLEDSVALTTFAYLVAALVEGLDVVSEDSLALVAFGDFLSVLVVMVDPLTENALHLPTGGSNRPSGLNRRWGRLVRDGANFIVIVTAKVYHEQPQRQQDECEENDDRHGHVSYHRENGDHQAEVVRDSSKAQPRTEMRVGNILGLSPHRPRTGPQAT